MRAFSFAAISITLASALSATSHCHCIRQSANCNAAAKVSPATNTADGIGPKAESGK